MKSYVDMSKDLLERKEQIKRNFNSIIKKQTHDEGILADAFNTRESIFINGEKFTQFKTSNEVKTALDNIMQKNSKYTYDKRSFITLTSIGCTQTQLEFLRIDEILTYAAIQFLAYSDVVQSINDIYMPYFNDMNQTQEYLDDMQNLGKELDVVAGNEIMSLLAPRAFQRALDALDNSVSDIKNLNVALKDAGRDVLDTAKGFSLDSLDPDKLAQLTKLVSDTSKMVQNITLEKVQDYTVQVQQAIDLSRNYARAELLSGAMLVFLGIALIITSIIIAVATFGGATPLSVVALPLGSSLVITGITLAATAGSGLLVTATGGLVIACAQKEGLAEETKNLTKTLDFKTTINQMKDIVIGNLKQSDEASDQNGKENNHNNYII